MMGSTRGLYLDSGPRAGWSPDPDRFYLSIFAGERDSGGPVDWTITRGEGADGITYAYGTDRLATVERGKRWAFVEGSQWRERFGWLYREVQLRNPRGYTFAPGGPSIA